jgi:hypothetical protein
MGQSLADSFPQELKNNFAERNVGIGSVIKIYDRVAQKEKWHLIVGINEENILAASIRINTELNTKCIPEQLRRYHILIKRDRNQFLGLTSKTLCLGINISKSKEEKIYICNPSQSHSKGFDFSIKRFGGGIGGTISKEVEYFVIVFINSGRDGIERFKF